MLKRHPSSPRILADLTLSALVGLVFGVALSFGLEYLDDSLKNKDEAARYLRLPVLAMVPDFAKVTRLA